MTEIFWAKLYCYKSFLPVFVGFEAFCYIMMSADDVCWNVWTNIKKLYVRNNIFKKRIPNITFWIIYILAQISFLATALGRFSQCFFKFFVDGQAWWPTFLLSPSTIKKLSTVLSIWNVLKSNGICPFYLIFYQNE